MVSLSLGFRILILFVNRPKEGTSYAEPLPLIERRHLMAAPCIAPPVEMPVEKIPLRVSEPKPVSLKERIRALLVAIFEGHEEFLGWTPD